MTPARHARVTEIFLAVVALPPAERASRIALECAGDDELRAQVERMLAADSRTAALDASLRATRVGAALRAEAAAPMPARIGDYEILAVLGRGGMGTVYRARQAQPERIVALKVLSAGGVSPAILRRFEFEALILGRLMHPGIAQVYEAGVADVGGRATPFFAMELVSGQPLTEFAGRAKLDVRERLALLVRVCDAVQHAHQKGVIHRDLKPANILIDERGQPKVLDFGVARVTSAELQPTTLHTLAGQLVGTVPYMSPEQVSGDPDLVDTRSDVYALGVVAFELLTGELPNDLGRRSLIEAVQIIRDAEPQRVSTLNRACAGDVETIVHKALQKDREQRYRAVSDLAIDLQRFLDDQPILARPPSLIYQLGKFARRNRLLVGAACGMLALLIGGIVGTSYGLLRALAIGADLRVASDAAEKQAARALAANRFLHRMLSSANPLGEIGYGGREVTVLEMLDRESGAIGRSFAGQPAVEAEVRAVIGTTYKNLQRFDDAEKHLQIALDMHQRLYGEDSPEAGRVLRELAGVAVMRGRKDGIAMLERSLAIERAAARGAPNRDWAMSESRLGWALSQEGRQQEAEAHLRSALDLLERLGESAAEELPTVLNNLARAVRRQQRIEEAEALYRRALDGLVALHGDEHASVAIAWNNIAKLRYDAGAHDEAEVLFRRCLDGLKRTVGEQSVYYSDVLNNLAYVVFDRGQVPQAIELQREAVRIHEAVTGRDNRSFVGSLDTLAYFLTRAGEFDEALRCFAENRSYYAARNGEGDWRVAVVDFYMAESRARLALGMGPGNVSFVGRTGAIGPQVVTREELALRTAFEELRGRLDTDAHPAIREAAGQLVRYYKDTLRPELGTEYEPLTRRPAAASASAPAAASAPAPP